MEQLELVFDGYSHGLQSFLADYYWCVTNTQELDGFLADHEMTPEHSTRIINDTRSED